jgi:hypothetical protein
MNLRPGAPPAKGHAARLTAAASFADVQAAGAWVETLLSDPHPADCPRRLQRLALLGGRVALLLARVADALLAARGGTGRP